MQWCEDLKLTYTCAKRIAKEKFDTTFGVSEFEDMVKDFKKKHVLGFTKQEIEILVENYLSNQRKQDYKLSENDFADNNYLKCRLITKKEQLQKKQDSFIIQTRNIDLDSFEDNAINHLLEMKTIKNEIRELETILQFLEINN